MCIDALLPVQSWLSALARPELQHHRHHQPYWAVTTARVTPIEQFSYHHRPILLFYLAHTQSANGRLLCDTLLPIWMAGSCLAPGTGKKRNDVNLIKLLKLKKILDRAEAAVAAIRQGPSRIRSNLIHFFESKLIEFVSFFIYLFSLHCFEQGFEWQSPAQRCSSSSSEPQRNCHHFLYVHESPIANS